MKKVNIKNFVCKYSDFVVYAMKKIDKNSVGLLYVLNEYDALVGCISDGDIRRWIIKGGNIDAEVREVMNSRPIYVYKQQKQQAFARMKEKQIGSIAVVDEKLHITEVLFLSQKNDGKISDVLADIPVIIMAGGRGTRLYPYTKILPKPLIPVGDIPIIERVINHFSRFGAVKYYLTVNYKKEMIKAYFADSVYKDSIIYVEEDMPLGTAGSIGLINEEFHGSVMVTNCDILIEADYEDILRYHNEKKNDMTIVSSLKNTIIPYGVLWSKGNGIVSSMEEKPEISNFINTGMYIVDSKFFSWIPKNEVFHMTDLAEKMMNQGKQVGMYPISEEAFLDMGQFEEMKKMERRINSGDYI